MGRILAIDYGLKRTGIAVSDPLRIIAGGLVTVPTVQLRSWLDEYFLSEQVDIVVFGMPRRMDGSQSESYVAIKPFYESLKRDYPSKKVVLFDERFTSVLAHKAMIEGGMKKMKRRDKAVVDRISATIILEDYMQSRDYQSLISGDNVYFDETVERANN